MSYDAAITVFAPNGQLLQVEYALEAVRLGNCTLGLLAAGHAVLAAERRVARRLQDAQGRRKISAVDRRVLAASAGLGADARVVVDRARLAAQQFKLDYDDEPSVDYIARRVAALMQHYTQKGGARPFGTALLLAGVERDGGVALSQVDPSGTVTCYSACALGRAQQRVQELLERHYAEDMSLDAALRLAARCLADNVDNPRKNVEVAVVGPEGARFLSAAELDALFRSLEAQPL